MQTVNRKILVVIIILAVAGCGGGGGGGGGAGAFSLVALVVVGIVAAVKSGAQSASSGVPPSVEYKEVLSRAIGDGGETVEAIARSGDFSYLLAGETGTDAWVAKVDSGGALTWSRSISGRSGDVAKAKTLTPISGGNVIVAGSVVKETRDVDVTEGPTNSNLASEIGFIAKIGLDGDLVWKKLCDGACSARSYYASARVREGFVLLGIGTPKSGDVSIARSAVLQRFSTEGALKKEIFISSLDDPANFSRLFSDSLGRLVFAITTRDKPGKRGKIVVFQFDENLNQLRRVATQESFSKITMTTLGNGYGLVAYSEENHSASLFVYSEDLIELQNKKLNLQGIIAKVSSPNKLIPGIVLGGRDMSGQSKNSALGHLSIEGEFSGKYFLSEKFGKPELSGITDTNVEDVIVVVHNDMANQVLGKDTGSKVVFSRIQVKLSSRK